MRAIRSVKRTKIHKIINLYKLTFVFGNAIVVRLALGLDLMANNWYINYCQSNKKPT